MRTWQRAFVASILKLTLLQFMHSQKGPLKLEPQTASCSKKSVWVEAEMLLLTSRKHHYPQTLLLKTGHCAIVIGCGNIDRITLNRMVLRNTTVIIWIYEKFIIRASQKHTTDIILPYMTHNTTVSEFESKKGDLLGGFWKLHPFVCDRSVQWNVL